MKMLESVEDFEKAFALLRNPASEPHEYRVRSFGYCTFCSDITEYSGNYGLEGLDKRCHKCGRFFGKRGATAHNANSKYLTGDRIPKHLIEEVNRLHSRVEQERYFYEELEKYFHVKRKALISLREELQKLCLIAWPQQTNQNIP